MMNLSKVFFPILFVLFANGISFADTTDRAAMTLTYNYKLDTPVEVFIQKNKSKSKFYTYRERLQDSRESLTGLAERKGCKVDEVFEIRFIAPKLLACSRVIPMEGDSIKYETIDNENILSALMIGADEKKWQHIDELQKADLALLIEVEITNLVNIDRRQNKTWNTAATNMSAPSYEPMYIFSVNINAVNSDPTVEDRIVFTARLKKYFYDYPSDKTLESLMMAVGEKIRKQKSFGRKGSNVLRFTNFESAKK